MLAPDLLPRQSAEASNSSGIHNRIFDAAIEILAESGLAEACTNHIAQRAGVSVGSIYRFYPNKYAIYKGIADRYLDCLAHTVSESTQLRGREKPLAEVVDEFVERSAKFYQKNAALCRAWNVLVGNPEINVAESRFADRVFEIFADYLAEVAPSLSPADCRRISMTLVWPSMCLLELSVADPSGHNRELVDETKILANAYLRAVLDPKLFEGEPA